MTDTVDVEACVRLLADYRRILKEAVHKCSIRSVCHTPFPCSTCRGICGDIDQVRALASALPGIGKDSERLDWLEGEAERERVADQRLNTEPNCPIRFPRSLYRSNMPITREAIDAARAAQPQETSADAT